MLGSAQAFANRMQEHAPNELHEADRAILLVEWGLHDVSEL